MPRRSARRTFEGIKDTKKIRKAIVCGGRVLRHKEQWAQHEKPWRVALERRIESLSEDRTAECEELQLELEELPSKEDIARMPTLTELRAEIEGISRRVSKFMSMFSRLLLFHVHRALDNDLPIPALNQSGLQKLQQMCSPNAYAKTLAKNKQELPDFADSVASFFKLLSEEAVSDFTDKGLLKGLKLVLNYELRRHATAISNHMVHTFSKRCLRWIAFRLKQLEASKSARSRKKLAGTILARILEPDTTDEGQATPSSNKGAKSKPQQTQQQQQQKKKKAPPKLTEEQKKRQQEEQEHITIIENELKALFRPTDTGSLTFPLTKKWLKERDHWTGLLFFYRGVNTLFAKNGLKLFDLLPLCSFRNRCITLDHQAFCDLFKVPTEGRESVPWSRFLRLGQVHLDKRPGPNRTTVTSVQTDGTKFVLLCEKFVPKKARGSSSSSSSSSSSATTTSQQDLLTSAAVAEDDNGDDDNDADADLDAQMDEAMVVSSSSSEEGPPKKKQKKAKATATASAAPPTPPERRVFDGTRGVIKMTQLEAFSGPVDIVGLDPGVKDMFAVVDGDNHFSRLTRKQFDSIVGVKGDHRKLDRWKQKTGIHTLENSIATSSASNFAEFERHVTSIFGVAGELHDFYGARRVTRMRLAHHIRRDKLVDGFINQVFMDRGPPMSKRRKKAMRNAQRRARRRRKRHNDPSDANMSDLSPQSPPDHEHNHPTSVCKRRRRKQQQQQPPHTELGKKEQKQKKEQKKKKKKPSGSQRRKRKKERKLTSKQNKATADRSNQDVQIRTNNRFLRRENAVGKRSLLQEQCEREQQLASAPASESTSTSTSTSAAASTSLASPSALESASSEGAQAQTRQKVVAYGAATFRRALRGWSGVPGKRLCYRLQKRLPVVLVNEFNTSQIGNATLQKLKNVQCWQPVRDAAGNRTAESKLAPCWGLKE